LDRKPKCPKIEWNSKMWANLIKEIKELPQARVYKNSTDVCRLRGVSLIIWDVITAAIISGLNILVVGEKGEGKTQLLVDINNSLFGGRGTFIRAHPDLKTRDIYTSLNLEILASGKGDTHQALELAESIKNPLTILDEINRVPQITQNQALSILDGYISLPEKSGRFFFGIDGYHIGLATANLTKDYGGTFPFDPAYLDRSHLILNVDNFPPGTTDLIEIQQQDTTPRVISPELEDSTDKIIRIWQQMKKTKLSLDGLMADLYLKRSLDYCDRSPSGRKSTVRDDIPAMCQGCLSEGKATTLGDVCAYVVPATTRSFKAFKALAFGLTAVSQAKSEVSNDELPGYREILQAFRLTAPYSGIFDASWIKRQHHGNPYLASDFLYRKIKSDLEEKADYIKKAFYDALSGTLAHEEVKVLGEEWGWLEEILTEINKLSRNSPKPLVEQIKEGKILATNHLWLSDLLWPEQTIFGEKITHLKPTEKISKKISDRLGSMYGIAFATEDGIYAWYENLSKPRKILDLERGKFRRKRITGLALVGGKLVFSTGREIYQVENPQEPLMTSDRPLEALTQSGDSLVGAEERKIWIKKKDRDQQTTIFLEKKVTALASVPVYKLKEL
ncbi:MAG: ATP-binding protein, partial [bacterium]